MWEPTVMHEIQYSICNWKINFLSEISTITAVRSSPLLTCRHFWARHARGHSEIWRIGLFIIFVRQKWWIARVYVCAPRRCCVLLCCALCSLSDFYVPIRVKPNNSRRHMQKWYAEIAKLSLQVHPIPCEINWDGRKMLTLEMKRKSLSIVFVRRQ